MASNPSSAPVMSGSMNWEPVRKRLLGNDLSDTLKALGELRENIEIVHTTEFPLLLSALLPAFSSVLADRTRPSPDTTSIDHQIRHSILDIISKLPTNEILRPHAPHLVALAMDILNRDYEENALVASRIIFDLYKSFRSLPQEYVQPFLDFVIKLYRGLPSAVQRNFSLAALSPSPATPAESTSAEEQPAAIKEGSPEASSSPASTPGSLSTPPPRLALRSNVSFRVLTESPLIVMLMLQLYPAFLKTNISVMIAVMMEVLAIRVPSIQTLVAAGADPRSLDTSVKRHYYARARELVAAQAKTLSFVTYLLRSFSSELKPYEDRLATNVVTLMTTCPRESISTRKELLVATRHLLNSEFKKGFFRHVETLLDERVLMGTHHRFSDQALLRPLGYTTLSDLIQQVRERLTMTQMAKVVGLFSRVLHDSSLTLPLSTQCTAVRTLLSVLDVIFHNKDPNPQTGRDLLLQTLETLTAKLEALVEYFPAVVEQERERELRETAVGPRPEVVSDTIRDPTAATLSSAPPDTVRDVHVIVRAIMVGQKTVLYYLNAYRNQRDKDKSHKAPPPGSNEEVSSAVSKLTHTEVAAVDRYILAAFPAAKLLSSSSAGGQAASGNRLVGEKSLAEQHREVLTYLGASFTAFDGINLARTLGRRLDFLVDAIVDDPMVMIVPRQLLGGNQAISTEFCTLLLDHLMDHIDELAFPNTSRCFFFDPPLDTDIGEKADLRDRLQFATRFPVDSDARRRLRASTLLQLFERVLKSLSPYPQNESIVRRHLRKIVVVCLRASMEEADAWPDNYCMLLRHVFRIISAGKFEESYKELLPLIPTVLNGLYRVISSSRDSVLRRTAVELCLTIPARLSSLLPHMSLLLRVIIPALDSQSGDLVNLGLRTLEFWIDNLNPLFLYPEMSKQTELFASLMQALSRHLRPAPYPYGHLTLRLLGKLGGNNRQFLREPLQLREPETLDSTFSLSFSCSWTLGSSPSSLDLPMPLDRCVAVLKLIACPRGSHVPTERKPPLEDEASAQRVTLRWSDSARLWTEDIENVDMGEYTKDVTDKTRFGQAQACLTILNSATQILLADGNAAVESSDRYLTCLGLMYACMVKSLKEEALSLLNQFLVGPDCSVVTKSLIDFLLEPSAESSAVGIEVVRALTQAGEGEQNGRVKGLLEGLCDACTSRNWGDRSGLQEAICCLVEEMGAEWSYEHEVVLVNAAFVSVKSVPRELSQASIVSLRFFFRICAALYGKPGCSNDDTAPRFVWDPLAAMENDEKNGKQDGYNGNISDKLSGPSDEVFHLVIAELASPQQIVRFAARYLMKNFVIATMSKEESLSFVSNHVALIRRVLFSRSLRLLPLSQQVGVIDGLAMIMCELPGLLQLTDDQHLLPFLSEVLKMASVADGEMTDAALTDAVVDKNGFAKSELEASGLHPSHASALFFRRTCVVEVDPGLYVVVPEEVPAGIQQRISAIVLLHSVIRGHADTFFDAEVSTPVGNIRPHVISLLFRSLASAPPKAVTAAHNSLRDVLALSMVTKPSESAEGKKASSRLPKELLQTCIRPVLLHLRDYSRLSVPLLRGLARLLSLLSSWFNRTLGEKLLDHLQKWLDPGAIIARRIWRQGEEPLVAAAIVDIFALLPHASDFVDPLVKTCIKLEATLPVFKARFSESPYRRPLARYLNRHANHSVNFFFQRLKAPMYSELFQSVICLDESDALRSWLSNKQCSVMILNYCFEKPLAIIRSEKSAHSTVPLYIHGIGTRPPNTDAAGDSTKPKPMSIEALELQYQGFRLVETLLAFNPNYLAEHNDIVRAFRWLWRSKGRFIRLQHADAIPPRYHGESTMLASFLMTYGKSFPHEDFDILFELIRVFLQPCSSDFSFVSRFLRGMVSQILTVDQKKQVLRRFFALIAGESSEETKVLSIQFLIYPLIASDFGNEPHVGGTDGSDPGQDRLVDRATVEKFVSEVLFAKGSAIACGDRLRVELLKLSNLLVFFAPTEVEDFRKEIVRFCWGLLKSDDTSCKGWAYVVVCRFIAAFETPEKIVLQVFFALAKSHQQEGRELVREALDVLVPALSKRLTENEFHRVVDQCTKMMLEDGNSTPQLAHICQLVVRNPSVFYPTRARFAGYMLNSLTRLGLPPNCPPENRIIAVAFVELLLQWDEESPSSDAHLILGDQVHTVANFLVRLKILMAEPTDGRAPRPDTSTASLETRINNVLEQILLKKKCCIREQPFEKVVSKDRKAPALLLSCLEVLSLLQKGKQYDDFFLQHCAMVKDVVAGCFKYAKEDDKLQREIRSFVIGASDMPVLAASMFVSLERSVVDATNEMKKGEANRASDANGRHSGSRGRERPSSSDPASVATKHALLSLELFLVLCRHHPEHLRLVEHTLLGFAGILTKDHLHDAAAKQRHGASASPRMTASGTKQHSPTMGILESSCSWDHVDFARSGQTTPRGAKECDLPPPLRCLAIILAIFEPSDVVCDFTYCRKSLFQIISSLLETSDCLQVLLIATRIVCKWLLRRNPGVPLTSKERSHFLSKISLFDFCCLPDDATAQPLGDLVAIFANKLLQEEPSLEKDSVIKRLLVGCLLNANDATRGKLLDSYMTGYFGAPGVDGGAAGSVLPAIYKLLESDFEAVGGRFWVTVLVDAMLRLLSAEDHKNLAAIRLLVHGDVTSCQRVIETLLPRVWADVDDDQVRRRLLRVVEGLLAKPFHCQFLRDDGWLVRPRSASNACRSLLNAVRLFRPIPVLDSRLLVFLAENYSSWHEVLSLLEGQYVGLSAHCVGEQSLVPIRHCYRLLGESKLWLTLAGNSCQLPSSRRALSCDIYGFVTQAADSYSDLVEMVEANSSVDPSEFEMDVWEERWIQLQKELYQLDVVSAFAESSGNSLLRLECAWKAQDWAKVRALCSSASLFPSMESGEPIVKISETLLAVADGKLSDVENLNAQTGQLCLYKWQLLPGLSSGSPSHESLFQFFHRLVEIRESGQIMVETSNHSSGRTLPDLKNLLSAWRHRLPNDYDPIATWDEIFSWRTHMFSAVTSNFQSLCEPNTLATLHDRPWTAIRMAKTARKQGLREVSLLLLNKDVEERAMNVTDAFLKLREQILTYYNPESELERHGGLNLINTTNLSFFDAPQKSELFRLKAMFLASLGGRSKSTQAYCHSVQICPGHARAWESWGGLCSSLGSVAEKQLEQAGSKGDSTDAAKDPRAVSKKVAQYLAQAMGCYIEAVMIDTHDWARVHLPKCLWMLTKDGASPGVLCQTLEKNGSQLPAWVWLPWLPQLLTSLYRQEGRAVKSIFAGLAKAYPQAVYYALRAFYLERRDVERAKGSNPPAGQMNSVVFAEEMMSLLRRTHASLWSSLEAVLEELIVKFRPLPEEELLSPMIALLERAEAQLGSNAKNDDEESVTASIWKTIWRMAAKFFKASEPGANRTDERAKKTAEFKDKYRASFEADFHVSAVDAGPNSPGPDTKVPLNLEEFVVLLRSWKAKLEKQVCSNPQSLSLIQSSHSLAMFAIGEAPDLWPGSCDPRDAAPRKSERGQAFSSDTGVAQSSTSSSAAAAWKAAFTASAAAAAAAAREGVGGGYGGGSACIEVPGQYLPNTLAWTDGRPNPELHAKLMRFEHSVQILRRSDQLVRRIGIVGNDGVTYKFLVQAAVPYWTRTDERTAQTLFVLDKVLRKSISSARAHLSVQPHSVIPMAQRLRLVSEPDSRISLDDVYREHCERRGRDPSELATLFNEETKEAMSTIAEGDDKEDRQIQRQQKLEVFNRIRNRSRGDSSLLVRHLESSLGGPELMYQLRRTFAQQWAANCLLQRGFAVAERTPGRVAFVASNGRVLSPEFRVSYNGQGFMENQSIPFRLTVNLTNLIGFPLLDGHFVPSMAITASAVREFKQDLTPILRLLMRDDVIAFYTRSMPKSDAKTVEMEKQLADRVHKNVVTLMTRVTECAPRLKRDEKSSDDPIDQRVKDLVAAARSPEKLCMMPSSYQAWL